MAFFLSLLIHQKMNCARRQSSVLMSLKRSNSVVTLLHELHHSLCITDDQTGLTWKSCAKEIQPVTCNIYVCVCVSVCVCVGKTWCKDHLQST